MLSKLRSTKDLRSLANLVHLKKCYPSGLIFRYRNCHADRIVRTGWSRTKFDRVLADFKARGWVKTTSRAIYVIGRAKLDSMYRDGAAKSRVKYITLDTEKDIVSQLRYQLIRTKVDQISYKKASTEAQAKGIQKKYYQILREAYHPLSSTTLSKTFSCSKSTARNIVKRLKKSKKIRVKKSKKVFLGFCSFSQWIYRHLWWNFKESVNRCFYCNGAIYFNDMNRYKLVEQLA